MARSYRLRRDHAPGERPVVDVDTELNEQQRAVVHAGPGVSLVIAGAGTGKTRALTARVAHLVAQGTPVDQILLLTFTNRASREMTRRVEGLLGQSVHGIVSGTFHSIGRRWVQEFSATLGFPETCQVIDREDAHTLLRQCYDVVPKEARRARRFPKPQTILSALSKSVNTQRTFADVVQEELPQFADLIGAFYDILVAYQEAKVERGLLDFDDLLIYSHRLLTEFPEISTKISQRYQHVLVDEYQDTNLLQAEIVDRVCAHHGNLTVVGDDHQSIYAFRGAVHDNILHFGQRHAAARTFYLTQNYRSSPQILRLANLSIAQNTRQYKKTLETDLPDGGLPALINARDQTEEALFCAQRMLELHEEGVPLSKIAVLYRAHSQVGHVELELSKRGIPYVLRSGKRLFERAHIKDLLCFLRLSLNPRDDLAAHRLFQLCEGIGDKTATKLSTLLAAYDTLSEGVRAELVQSAVPRRAKESFSRLQRILEAIDLPSARHQVAEALERIVDDFYRDVVTTKYDLPQNRLQDLDTLIELSASYGDYGEFLHAVALDDNLTGRDTLATADGDHVVLSSIHQAKGLEFHTVFVLSMNEEKFPIGAAMFDLDELEEERRLFYVAVTRAQRALYLCRPLIGPLSRQQYGPLRLSPFLVEVADAEPPAFESWSLE